jgi:hypothetical protein
LAKFDLVDLRGLLRVRHGCEQRDKQQKGEKHAGAHA